MPRLSAVSAALLSLSFAGVPAIQADITPVNYPTPLAATGPISGNIMNIDPVNNMIQVKDDNGLVQTIRVDDHVMIMRRGEVVRLVNLSLDDFVTVRQR